MDEFDLIDQLIAPLAAKAPGSFGLANDAAVIAPSTGCELVITKDMMAEGVHFLPDDPADLVARKLLRTNLSDLAAMGARPRGYLLGLALDADREDAWVTGFIGGLAADQEEFGLTLLGGDTIAVPHGVLTLSLTALGEVETGRALTRSGARDGDIVGVSGTIGDGALGLMARRGKLDAIGCDAVGDLVTRYRLPQPRLALGACLPGLATAALDVSDGLLQDLGHIARRSAVAVRLDWPRIPLSQAARLAIAVDPALRKSVMSGGDDYELLFTAPPARWDEIEAAGRACGTQVTRIGCCAAGAGVVVLDEHGNDITPGDLGWRHSTAI